MPRIGKFFQPLISRESPQVANPKYAVLSYPTDRWDDGLGTRSPSAKSRHRKVNNARKIPLEPGPCTEPPSSLLW